jgi:hypothetical protein
LLIPRRSSNSLPLARANRERAKIRFDMFGADLTFELQAQRLNLKSPALRTIVEIVHNIDLKDGRGENFAGYLGITGSSRCEAISA